jgi:hypothetical protein
VSAKSDRSFLLWAVLANAFPPNVDPIGKRAPAETSREPADLSAAGACLTSPGPAGACRGLLLVDPPGDPRGSMFRSRIALAIEWLYHLIQQGFRPCRENSQVRCKISGGLVG